MPGCASCSLMIGVAFRRQRRHHRRVMGVEHRQRVGAVLKAVVERPFQNDVLGHAGLRFAVGSRTDHRLVNVLWTLSYQRSGSRTVKITLAAG